MWKKGEDGAVHDDSIHIVRSANSGYIAFPESALLRRQNTQSGSQWDGLRHFGLLEHRIFYNKCGISLLVIAPVGSLRRRVIALLPISFRREPL